MSYSFGGANDNIAGSFSSTYNGEGLTIACHFKITTWPGAVDMLVQLGNTLGSTADTHALRLATATDTVTATSISGGTSSATHSAVTGIAGGGWFSLLGTFVLDADRNIYINAIGNTTQNTTSRAVADLLKHISIGEGLDAVNDFTGLIAEVAIWNSVLSSANITSYLGGTAASGIASANLIGYWPLSASNSTQSNLGVDADGDLAVTGATFSSDHPTISSGSTTITPNIAGMSV